MIDKKWIGHELPESVLPIEQSRLQFFAKATGETRAKYIDVAPARAAGYAELPAPTTFLMAAELDSGGPDGLLRDWQIPFSKLLHDEQSFTYYKPICAGDTITVRSTISAIYEKTMGRWSASSKTHAL
jgi:hypothetical protein